MNMQGLEGGGKAFGAENENRVGSRVVGRGIKMQGTLKEEEKEGSVVGSE